jgi:hypothetical protein
MNKSTSKEVELFHRSENIMTLGSTGVVQKYKQRKEYHKQIEGMQTKKKKRNRFGLQRLLQLGAKATQGYKLMRKLVIMAEMRSVY